MNILLIFLYDSDFNVISTYFFPPCLVQLCGFKAPKFWGLGLPFTLIKAKAKTLKAH